MPKALPGLEGQSLSSARHLVHSILSGAGFENSQREARLLIEFATGLTAERILLCDTRPLSGREARVLAEAITRRLAHEPLSRIKGERNFYGRMFEIGPAVLDPRPETEALVDLVLEWADNTGGRHRPMSIVDIGTGSGCILVTLLAELPFATGVGTDVSDDAIRVARGNAERHTVAARARFELARSLEGMEGPFDILVSNPPYIPSKDIAGLDPAVRDFDPRCALDGGADGLDVYREIAARAGAVVPAGLIALEVGAGQAPGVARIFADAVENRSEPPWSTADLGGHNRTVALLTQS